MLLWMYHLDILRTIWMNEDHVSSNFTSSQQLRGSEQKEGRKISYEMQFPFEDIHMQKEGAAMQNRKRRPF